MHSVDQLATQSEGAGYYIYTDRFYTSPALAVKLLEEGNAYNWNRSKKS